MTPISQLAAAAAVFTAATKAKLSLNHPAPVAEVNASAFPSPHETGRTPSLPNLPNIQYIQKVCGGFGAEAWTERNMSFFRLCFFHVSSVVFFGLSLHWGARHLLHAFLSHPPSHPSHRLWCDQTRALTFSSGLSSGLGLNWGWKLSG